MEKDKIIELFKKYCLLDITNIFNMAANYGFIITKSVSSTSVPIMTSFKQNNIDNNIIVMPDFVPSDQFIWLLEYMLVYYFLNKGNELYIIFDNRYQYDEKTIKIIEEINGVLNNGIKRYK